MKVPYAVFFPADPDQITWLRPLLLTALCLSACAGKSETQRQQTQTVTPKAATPSAPSMKATLLAVAQTDETLRERPFCPLSIVGKQGIYVSKADYNSSEKYQAWIQQEYFTQQTVSQSQFKLIPTPRYLEILNHATNPASPTPRICLGTAHLKALTNLRQINPDKFMADAPLTPTLAAWVTPEIMKLFGPSRNHPVYVPLTLIFLRNGDTWTVERL